MQQGRKKRIWLLIDKNYFFKSKDLGDKIVVVFVQILLFPPPPPSPTCLVRHVNKSYRPLILIHEEDVSVKEAGDGRKKRLDGGGGSEGEKKIYLTLPILIYLSLIYLPYSCSIDFLGGKDFVEFADVL